MSDTSAQGSNGGSGEPFPAPDSIMMQLMQRSGFRPVVYRGDTLSFTTLDRSIHIRERASIERAGEELTADSVVYEGDTRYMTAYGKSRLVNANGEEVTSEEGPFFYNTDTRVGTVIDGRTKWELWNVRGDFTMEGTDTLWVNHGQFTTCDLAEPHYHFEGNRIKLVFGHIVVAWPVRLYFGDVPVFWFPFFAQDIRPGRHSGILTPRFGVNDIVRNSSGHSRNISNVGYYWAMSEYTDAQVSMDWWSDRWTRFNSFFRYRWRRQFLDGRFGYSHFFLPEGGREIALTWNHSQKFGERSDLRASVQYVSSQSFTTENEFNPERLVQQIRSDVGFTRRFDWGTLNLSGQRIQPLTEDEETTLNAPQIALTLAPFVPFRARSPLEARWFSSLTGNGSFSFQRSEVDAPLEPDRVLTNGGLTSTWALGNLRLGGNANYRENAISTPDLLFTLDTSVVMGDTVLTQDTVVIGAEINDRTIDWRAALGYQQHLIGSTTLTPALDLSGSSFRSNQTGRYVSGPVRLSANARLVTDIYGFFPGFGSLERIRHKFSPSLTWSYSPEVRPSPEITGLRGFSPGSSDERHQLTVGLNQTFEARRKPREQPADEEAEADTTRSSRPAEGRKITLLALRTTAVTYDFVAGELVTDRLSNNMTSDLLRGLTIRTEHDLFEETPTGREFKPFLSQLNLSFSIGDRTLGQLLGSRSAGVAGGSGILPETRQFGDPAERDQLIGEPPPEEPSRPAGPRRPWTLSLDYSLLRPRPLQDAPDPFQNQQSIRGRLGLSPTDNWTISWRTTYDITRGDFADHTLSLRRDLHRWSATFEFLKAANGNFVFEFFVNLNDLPDVKFNFRERD